MRVQDEGLRQVANGGFNPQPGRSTAAPAAPAAPVVPLPLQAAMIQSARNGDAPWADLEQLVVHDPDPPPSADVLARALDTLARRHEGLRLVATEGPDGAPIWMVRARAVVGLTTRDFSALDAAAQERALAVELAQDRDAGIDLAAASGWRVLLADLGAQGHALVLTVHHAMLDGPGMAAVIAELYDLIAGREPGPVVPDGMRSALAALAALPADAPERARALLADFDAPGRLLRPGGEGPARRQWQRRTLPEQVSVAFRVRAAEVGTFAMVQAAWALVLARWTGETDLAFGLTLAGRNRVPGAEGIAGCLIATLPQRVRLDDRPDLDTLAARLRTQTGTLRTLHGADAGALRRWAGLPPGLTLFDSLLVFSRTSLSAQLATRGQGWERRRVRLIEEGSAPLTVAVYDDPALAIEIEHDPARLPPAKATRLADHLARMLAAIAASAPGVATGDLEMLALDEAARLDRLARPDRPAPPAPTCLAASFARTAAAQPRAPALINPDGVITRADLAARAHALARALAAATQPGGRVAVCLPRGADWTVALLACLTARRVFVPFDPAQPAELAASVAKAAGITALIAADGALPSLAVPRLDPDQGRAATGPGLPPADPDACAYVIHTSGTTGLPKGVMGRLGALTAHAAACADAYGLTPADRVLAVAAPAFDVALEEVLPTLLAGAAVVFAPPEALGSVPALLDLIAAERVTVLNLPASLWHTLTDEMERRRLRLPPAVRLVVTGSERVAPGALAIWRRLAPGVAWINAYGPTEATITALAHRLDPGAPMPDPTEDVPVGRPLAHATARVLAFDGAPAPEGAPGELVLGGEAISLGYLDRPDETAAAFVPDRSGPPGARAYATGDRARWRADGRLDLLGRRDRQVKLRGHRIDLGGIERALGGLAGVREVHVALDPAGGRLLAWIAGPAATGGPAALERLRTEAARRLHGPSLPVLVPVAALPLRANGKIDPDRLPRPTPAAAATAPAASRPVESHLLEQLLQVMAEVLEQDGIDPDTDFRDQGGHSLAALRLAGTIETRFGRRTRTTDLYRHPTPRMLAAHLAAPPADGPRYIVPIQPQGAGVPFFAVHVLGEKENLYRPLAAALGPDRPVLGLTMGPPKDPDAVSIRAVARAYFEDIQRHHPTGPLALGAVSMAAYFAYDLAQLLRAAGRDVRLLAVFDAEGPGGRPPLAGRARLRAHLGELARRGPRHLAGVLRTRLERVRFARDLALAGPDQVNGAALVWANVRAVEAYRPEPWLGRMAVFRAADSFWDSPAAIASGLGWAPVARGGIETFDIPGDHLTILQPGNVEAIAAHLTRLLPLE